MRKWFSREKRRIKMIERLRESLGILQREYDWLACWKERIYTTNALERREFHEAIEANPWKFPKEIWRAVLEGNSLPLETRRLELYREINRLEDEILQLLKGQTRKQSA